MKVFTHFTPAAEASDDVRRFREQMIKQGVVLQPFTRTDSAVTGEEPALLLSDCPDVLSAWAEAGGVSVGYEHDDIRLSVKAVVTELAEIGEADLTELYDFLTGRRHLLFTAGGFRYFRPGFTDYQTIYEMQKQEPYLLPERYKNLNASELRLRYDRDMLLGRLNPALITCIFTEADSEKPLGQIGIEQSELTGSAYNLSYYVLPKHRGLGIGTRAVDALLKALTDNLNGVPLLAIIHKENHASVKLAKSCGFTLLPRDSELLKKRPEGFFTMVREDGADAE